MGSVVTGQSGGLTASARFSRKASAFLDTAVD